MERPTEFHGLPSKDYAVASLLLIPRFLKVKLLCIEIVNTNKPKSTRNINDQVIFCFIDKSKIYSLATEVGLR